MNKFETSFRFRRTVLALAACAAFLPVQAQTKIEEGNVSVGIGAVDGSSADRAMFGQYNGLRTDRAVGLLGVDYTVRNEEQSSWIDFKGTNLLGHTRELNLVWKNPGQWKFTANYGELVHYDPNTVNTGLLGSGSATPVVVNLPGGPGTGANLDLNTKRTGLGIGFAKWFTPDLQFEVDLKSEKKEGARMSGIGMNCPTAAVPVPPGCGITTGIATGWATLMVPEAIDATHSQIEAKLNYAVEKLRLSFGYYGSYYRNGNGSLNPVIPASLNNPLGVSLPLSSGLQALLSQPIALAPDNQSHQFDLTGNYDFSGTTRGTFKLGYAKATQNDSFAGAGLAGAPAGVGSLGAEVDTTTAMIGVTSRPIPKLSLMANVKYEDRDDRTPVAPYNVLTGSALPVSTNHLLPYQKIHGKMQAGWQFNSDYRGSVGADYESIDRGVFTSSSSVQGISALRQKTQETGFNAELRRRMTENLSGAINVSTSKRDGSDWLKPNSGNGVTAVANPADPATGFAFNSLFMPTLADRQRDKVKLYADWQPSENLTLQFSAENGTDKFTAPTTYGLQHTRMSQYAVDMGYALSDKWNLTGYLSYGAQTLNQSRYASYVMAFDNTSTGAGFGVTGKLSGTIEIGGNLAFMNDKNVYAQTLETFAGADSAALLAATGGLPAITFRQTALKLFGKYTLDKKSSIRLDLVHQSYRQNDWAWGYNGVPYTYSDGTTVTQKASQSVNFVGVTYNYQFK